MPFHGAKLALYLGQRLVVILRDMRPDIPFPGYWDLPGGGREADEAPLDCALRETREEIGLVVPPEAVHWGRVFENQQRRHWFFVANLPEKSVADIVFGDEGQGWQLMRAGDFLAHPRAVPQFQLRLMCYLKEVDLTKNPPLF